MVRLAPASGGRRRRRRDQFGEFAEILSCCCEMEIVELREKARAALDATLAKAGLPRSERRRLFKDAAVMPSADGTATPRAGFDVDAATRLISTIKA